jgi:hypothetical protein
MVGPEIKEPMTAQTQQLPIAPRASAPGNSTGQIVAIIVGSIIALGGIAVGVAGGGLLALFGGDSTISSGRHVLSTNSTALVSKVADIDDTADVADVVGRPEVRMSVEAAPTAKGVFVGIGSAADVERYLARAPIDEVTDFDVDPFKLTREPRLGSHRPAKPASRRFWVASGTGRDAASLNWKVRDGDYRLVVMNADGSRGVETAGSVGVKIPHLPAIAWVLIGSGLVFLLAGGTTIFVAVRSGRREVR